MNPLLFELNQAPEMVWEQLTLPENILKWMQNDDIQLHIQFGQAKGEPVIISGDLHGIAFVNTGVIAEWNPPHSLCFTHRSSLSALPHSSEFDTIISVQLHAFAGGTKLEWCCGGYTESAVGEHLRFYWQVALSRMRVLLNQLPE